MSDNRKRVELACRSTAMWLALCAVPAVGAAAQDPVGPTPSEVQGADEAGEAGYGTIVVTARRRGEAIQNVPIAITALTSEDIAKAGVQSVGDIANLSPNVTFQNALNLGTNFLTIRGQTQSQYAPPPAAIVIDGVLTISPLQFNVDEFDISQVEVLKGPQGAIYGRNAIAGALNVTTRRPGNDFEVRGLASYARGEEWKGKLSVSGPIIRDRLFVLAGLSATDRRGQVPNVTTGNYSDKFKDLTGRLRLLFTPAEDLEFDVKYTYSDAKGRSPDYIVSRSGNPRISSDPLDSNRDGGNPRKLHDLSGKMNWDFGVATATVTLAYVDVKENLDADFDFGPLDIIAVNQIQRESGFSQELRLASEQGNSLRWLVGGYHVKSKRQLGANIFVDPFFFGLTPAPTRADFLFSANNDVNHYETWSGFGQLEYDILPDLEIAAALRYDDDSLRQQPVGAGPAAVRRASFSKWQPKGTVTYKGMAGVMVYASVGQGFRSGDFNSSASTFGNAVIAAESATNYEVGAKARLFGDSLSLDAAFFRTDLKNGQFKLFDGGAATNVGINIDRNRINGFELAGALRLVEGFALRSSVGYADSKVRKFTPPPGFGGSTVIYIGNKPPRVSKYTFNFGADMEIPVGERLSLYARPEYRYLSKFYWDLENLYAAPSQNIVDLRVGLRHDAGWSVTGWVKNALNTKVTADYQPFVNTGHPLGFDAYYPPVGAIYGLEVAFRF